MAQENRPQSTDVDTEWVSTYGVMTAERILEYYQIRIPTEALKHALQAKNCFIHHILKVPLRNVFNGIMMQQAKDYMIFVQKLFVDYLLSGETTEAVSAPGHDTRDELESLRKQVLEHAESFRQIEKQYVRMIYDTQCLLIDAVKQWQGAFDRVLRRVQSGLEQASVPISLKTVTSLMFVLLSFQDEELQQNAPWALVSRLLKSSFSENSKVIIMEALLPFQRFDSLHEDALHGLQDRADSMRDIFKQYRKTFYDYIVKTNGLLKNLPDYRYDLQKIQENTKNILFDPYFDEPAFSSDAT